MASVEYQYSVQVKSRFELLGRDDLNVEDPDLYLKKIQARKSEPKPAVSAGKDKAAAKSAVVSKKSAAPVRKDSRENADQAESQVETRASNAVDDQQVLRSESWEARGRGRGGFTRSRPVAGSGQRQFDRHSGSDKTGVKPVMKKDGHGTGNWGSIDDVIEMATDPEVTIDEHLIDAGPEEPVAEPVEEVKTLTLKEYKSQQKATKPAIQLSTKASREANDGKDVFNNMIPSHKPKPVQQQVADLFEEDENKKQDEPVFFDFNRDKPPTNRGRGRTSGPNLFGRNQAHANTDPNEQNGENLEQSDRSPNWSMRGGPRRGGGEFGRGGRGRGAFDPERVGKGRGGFDSERGAGHGRGSFDPERGGRGRGAFGSERGAGRGRGNFDQEHSGRGRGGYDVERGGRGRGRGRGSYDPERGSHARGGYDPDRGSHGRGGYDPERGSHGRGGYDPERGSHARGGFDSERGNRGRSNFNSERGSRGRGGFDSERGNRSRGGFDSERGRRGHGGHEHEGDNAQVSLSNERGGSRGGRGRGFGTSEDGQGSSQRGRGSGFDRGRGFGGRERGFRGAGGFRNGRGTFEPNEPEIKSDVAPAAPAMDSEEDFPVLK